MVWVDNVFLRGGVEVWVDNVFLRGGVEVWVDNVFLWSLVYLLFCIIREKTYKNVLCDPQVCYFLTIDFTNEYKPEYHKPNGKGSNTILKRLPYFYIRITVCWGLLSFLDILGSHDIHLENECIQLFSQRAVRPRLKCYYHDYHHEKISKEFLSYKTHG